MGTSTSTGTLAAGSSRTFDLTPASAVTLTLSPNVRVTVTESPVVVSGSDVGGNATRVHNPPLPGTFTYGPYTMGGAVEVEVASNSGSSVAWSLVDTMLSRDSAGNVTGLVGLGSDIGDNVLLIGTDTRSSGDEKVAIEETNTNPDADNRPVLMRIDQAIDPAAAGTIDWHALDVRCYGGGANADFSANSGFYAAEGKTQFTGTAGQTMGKTVGVFGSSVMNGSSATLNLSIGVQGEIQNTGAGTTVNAAAFYAKTPIISAGAVTSAYGLFVQSVTGATANFAICTQAGRTWFHSTTAPPAGGSFKVGLLMSSTDTLGIYFGSGAPTVSAAQGSLYMRTDGSSTSTRLYVNTNGSTGWTNVTTAA